MNVKNAKPDYTLKKEIVVFSVVMVKIPVHPSKKRIGFRIFI